MLTILQQNLSLPPEEHTSNITQVPGRSFRKPRSSNIWSMRSLTNLLAYPITTEPIASICLPDYRRFFGYTLCRTNAVAALIQINFIKCLKCLYQDPIPPQVTVPQGRDGIKFRRAKKARPSINAASYESAALLRLILTPYEDFGSVSFRELVEVQEQGSRVPTGSLSVRRSR